MSHPMPFRGITGSRWQQLNQLPPDYTPPAWETLYLDAQALLPDVHAAIVLAAAAIETFINECIDKLAANSSVPSDLWEWINNRNYYIKNPSVEDQLDTFLKVFTGNSLKDNPKLWEAYQQLRSARNSLTHEGVLKVGKRNKKAEKLSPDQAAKLVNKAPEIIEYIEALLPAEMRRLAPLPAEPITFRANPEAILKRSLELRPNDQKLLNELGIFYGQQGRIQEAKNVFERAIQLNPEFADPHFGLGNIYYSEKRYEEAIEKYKKAIKLNPRGAAFYNGLGSAYLEQGNYTESISAYHQAMILDVKDILGHSDIRMMDRYTHAVESRKRAALERIAEYGKSAEVIDLEERRIG